MSNKTKSDIENELATAKAEIEQLSREHSMLENINERLTKERDDEVRLLREQIRVADVAFNHLNSEASELRAKLAERDGRLLPGMMTVEEFSAKNGVPWPIKTPPNLEDIQPNPKTDQ